MTTSGCMKRMLKEIYDYPLSPGNEVFDVGGYHGLWTEQLIAFLGFSPLVYIFNFEFSNRNF